MVEHIKMHKLIQRIGGTLPAGCRQGSLPSLYCTHDVQKKQTMIELEMQMLRDEGEFFVPDKVPHRYWHELLRIHSRQGRQLLYKHLKKIEISAEKKRERKEEARVRNILLRKASDANEHISYGFSHNSMFYRIGRTAINRFYNCNVANSIVLGQKLVLDFGYEENMNRRETQSCVDQVGELYGFNRVQREPFDLYFCNLARNSELDRTLHKVMPTLRTDKCLVTATDTSYLHVFPKEKLVYLTPDCSNDLLHFNHDDVYVIGAFADLRPSGPLSMAKAKREGLRMARLPLERYLHWCRGDKSLTLDQMVKILWTVSYKRSWIDAFKHVPSRKLTY